MTYLVEVCGILKCAGVNGHKHVDILVNDGDILAIGWENNCSAIVGSWPLSEITSPIPQSVLFTNAEKGHYLANVPEIISCIRGGNGCN